MRTSENIMLLSPSIIRYKINKVRILSQNKKVEEIKETINRYINIMLTIHWSLRVIFNDLNGLI